MDNRIVLAACIITGFAACRIEGREPRAEKNPSPPIAAPTASETQSSPVERNAKSDKLTRVADRSLVCMVNNQFMGRPQIPITVDGSVYYGCCEMCKDRLANDPTSRTAVDPVSARPVDKSVAVIGRAVDGSTLYFENDSNFLAYNKK